LLALCCKWHEIYLNVNITLSKNFVMPNEKTDSAGFATVNTDKERDRGGKGDAVNGAGLPGDKHTAANTIDTQTALAAASTKTKDDNKEEK
jgi:hypothetical protein